MIEYKNRALSKKGGAPFPFSAYVLRSYSSEPTDQQKPKLRTKNLEMDREQEEFYGLIKGWGLKDAEKELIYELKNNSVKTVKPDLA